MWTGSGGTRGESRGAENLLSAPSWIGAQAHTTVLCPCSGAPGPRPFHSEPASASHTQSWSPSPAFGAGWALTVSQCWKGCSASLSPHEEKGQRLLKHAYSQFLKCLLSLAEYLRRVPSNSAEKPRGMSQSCAHLASQVPLEQSCLGSDPTPISRTQGALRGLNLRLVSEI